MPETNTAPAQETTAVPAPPAPPSKPPARKGGKGKQTRNLIVGTITLAAVAVGGFFLYKFLTAQDAAENKIYSATADLGSIASTVQGNGSAQAKETSAITLSQGGTVQELFVAAGDTVTAGQPLFTIFSQAAQDAVDEAQKKVDNLNLDMKDLYKDLNALTVTAPFAGKLLEVGEFQSGQTVGQDAAVATLVNDKKLKLSLYFSYAYENDITAGQSVSVSIPAVMGNYTGTVEKINKVSYISPEGAVHFEVVIAFDNPGTLTTDMSASAQIEAGGVSIYPYENGKTEYYETYKIITEAEGPLVSQSLLKYANVTAGQVLLVMGSDTIDEKIRAKQKEIDDAIVKLDEAQKALANYNAVAPIDGRVTSCTLVENGDVKGGETVLVISNTTTMLVNITVDDRNISFVKPGMVVDLSDWNNNVFQGTVSAINTGKAESANGMTTYPVTLTVDNTSGSLVEGAWLNYSFITSQSDNCIVLPSQAVKYVGNDSTVVFILAESKPENTVEVELPEVEPGQTPKYPTEADGYYPVAVEVGLSDDYNVEIKSGLQGGETVFLSYYVENSWG